jgi:hypothetical protein
MGSINIDDIYYTIKLNFVNQNTKGLNLKLSTLRRYKKLKKKKKKKNPTSVHGEIPPLSHVDL